MPLPANEITPASLMLRIEATDLTGTSLVMATIVVEVSAKPNMSVLAPISWMVTPEPRPSCSVTSMPSAL